jgi:hypothetical protein
VSRGIQGGPFDGAETLDDLEAACLRTLLTVRVYLAEEGVLAAAAGASAPLNPEQMLHAGAAALGAILQCGVDREQLLQLVDKQMPGAQTFRSMTAPR